MVGADPKWYNDVAQSEFSCERLVVMKHLEVRHDK